MLQGVGNGSQLHDIVRDSQFRNERGGDIGAIGSWVFFRAQAASEKELYSPPIHPVTQYGQRSK